MLFFIGLPLLVDFPRESPLLLDNIDDRFREIVNCVAPHIFGSCDALEVFDSHVVDIAILESDDVLRWNWPIAFDPYEFV